MCLSQRLAGQHAHLFLRQTLPHCVHSSGQELGRKREGPPCSTERSPGGTLPKALVSYATEDLAFSAHHHLGRIKFLSRSHKRTSMYHPSPPIEQKPIRGAFMRGGRAKRLQPSSRGSRAIHYATTSHHSSLPSSMDIWMGNPTLLPAPGLLLAPTQPPLPQHGPIHALASICTLFSAAL